MHFRQFLISHAPLAGPTAVVPFYFPTMPNVCYARFFFRLPPKSPPYRPKPCQIIIRPN